MMRRTISYSEGELNWIKACADLERREMHRLFCQIFARSDVTLVQLNSLCKRRGWMTGRTGCFAKGSVPGNKGKKGVFAAGSEKGWFKKGHPSPTAKYLGHRRITSDGYVEVSVAETNPHTGYERRYVQEHRWLWQQQHGPVPDGHRLKCLDGDKSNCDPSNWEALPLGMAPRLNGISGRGYDKAPAELKPVIMATAKLAHAVAARRRRAAEL